MLTPTQRDEFDRSGLLRLPGAVPGSDVALMRDRIWEFLPSSPDRPETWAAGPARHLQPLRKADAFAPMASERVIEALDDLLGEWQRPKTWGLPLVTFPDGGSPWRVPGTGWHVDSWGPEHELPGVTVFAFLLPVAASGGGTVVLAGSHRLVNRHIETTGTWKPAEVKAAAHPWLVSAMAGEREVGDEAVLDGVPVAVRELTGESGDVTLMHPRTLHAPAPNTAGTPRMMLVEIISR